MKMAEARIDETVCEDRISKLPEDLLVSILCLVPTRTAVATMLLSKRWLSIWTMVPALEYKDEDEGERTKSVWWFLDKSLQHHKAPLIDSIRVKLGSRCPTDVDVGKCVANAVDRRALAVELNLEWSGDPTRLPNSLYSSESLVELRLYHKILVDFPHSSCLPSLKLLMLHCVVYKDEDSLLRFLSSCPVLWSMSVERKKYVDDNVKKFSVKVPSLWILLYYNDDGGDTDRCLLIDTPALMDLSLTDFSGDYCSIENMPRLKNADLNSLAYQDDGLILRSLSSVLSLELWLNDETIVSCSAIKFARLIQLKIHPGESDWSEPLMLLLGNAPKVRKLMVDYESRNQSEDLTLSWNQPNSVQGCLSSQLETFEWNRYEDRKEEEEFLTYILANSKSLKTATITVRPTLDLEEKDLIMDKLKDIPRVSTTSQLLFKYATSSYVDSLYS